MSVEATNTAEVQSTGHARQEMLLKLKAELAGELATAELAGETADKARRALLRKIRAIEILLEP